MAYLMGIKTIDMLIKYLLTYFSLNYFNVFKNKTRKKSNFDNPKFTLQVVSMEAMCLVVQNFSIFR